ncbi:MAG: hypothetical protein LBC44_02740 [Mycoplasmataceae bacterium]|nr:hypothetical protein [Mycoplasmataceae bacterium]
MEQNNAANTKNTKQVKNLNFLWCLVGLLVGSGIIGVAIWQLSQCSVITKNPSKKSDYVIDKKHDTTATGFLAQPQDEIVLEVKSKTGKTIPSESIKWWYDTSAIDLNKFSFTTTNEKTLAIDVVSNTIITTSSTINVVAIIEDETEETVNANVYVGSLALFPTPVNDSVFTFGNDGGGTNDTITGFSPAIVANPDLLKKYNSLDFTPENSNIKYVSSDFVFPEGTFDDWNLLEINFGNLTYLPNDDGRSGNELFAGCDLHTVLKIDYSTSVWATEETSSSASHTFDGANLSSLKEIDLDEATFACEGMTEDDNGLICTADSTFANAILSNLNKLSLNDTVFASTGMTGDGTVHTAYKTFYNADLTSLETLDLSNSVFAASEMTTTGNIYTASETFEEADMLNIAELYLEKSSNKAAFAIAGMSTNGEVNTGYKTFQVAVLSNILKLEIIGDGEFGKDLTLTNGTKNIENETYKKTIFKIEYKPIPVTSEFFDFEETDFDDGKVMALKGFSSGVKDDPETTLVDEGYNALDFSDANNNDTNGEKIEYVNGECSFDSGVFYSWDILKIDFGNLTFLNNSNGSTGSGLFSGCKLSSLLVLDFGTSKWATEKTEVSANSTFSGFDLSNLTTLNLSNAVFACEKMGEDSPSTLTAFSTFYGANLSSLKELNLSNTKFAVDNMKGGEAHQIYTAFYTFAGVNLENLEVLNLAGTAFSAAGMTDCVVEDSSAGTDIITTANGTFQGATLTKLSSLIFEKDDKKAVFFSDGMSTVATDIHCGYRTFKGVSFSNLLEDSFDKSVFDPSGTNCTGDGGVIYSIDETFDGCTFKTPPVG